MRTRIPRSEYPICETCRVTRVKGRRNRFCCAGCVPKSVRQANCRKGRKTYSQQRRALMLDRFVNRLPQRTTKADIKTVMWEYGRLQYNYGFKAGRYYDAPLEDAVERGAA